MKKKETGARRNLGLIKLNRMLALLVAIFALLSVTFMEQEVSASGINSYTYYRHGEGSKDFYPVPAPSPYNYVKSIYAEDIGADSLYKANSMFVSEKYIYISSGNSIIITDHDFNRKHVIKSIDDGNGVQELTDINGLFVTKDEELYACEPQKGRVLHFNSDWTLKRILGRPEGIVINENVAYQPLKIVVDSVGRMYIVANNVYEGLVELNVDGTFSRYFGVVEVNYTPIELFWRSLQTEAQRARSAEWLPVNFSNIAIDNDDFVYATVAASGEDEKEPIRKLNAKGKNILRYPSSTGIYPQGDLHVNQYGQNIPKGKSLLTAVDINDYGVYAVLDSKRSRIFAYDDDGYMLYAIGESGTTEGRFKMPVDIKFLGDDKLLVLDRGNMSIEVLELNNYGRSIHNAVKYQAESDYRAAAEEWKKVIDYNPSFQYAYVGIGKALYRDGDHELAQKYFRLGQDVDYYSEAYKKTRQDFISDNFGTFVLVIAVLAVISMAVKMIRQQMRANKKLDGGING
ncbi:hypothetical protein CDQ84_14050 [Clostridium thermosuccinogenes]|uniref:Uncharacterized protein n=1 Tax=Clostridium thermosuccinogenes TaxID=84032 RepID=A0A2K2FE38_9CLOT|nr:hypothetical protein [Pseudoclostridium thermosuccinogenes]AUS95807.1 hypothetical protein CDO33_04725 [Pseudoclostridium thermosuccinogenes]PNT95759.1 hypothetical protein CDQ85_13920 [Pseudoclostridium thermosuccinogenes]PNT97043.1 hypothetical protein CDQ84_14050 [Pseudoclostridium thermosuccinogenes]